MEAVLILATIAQRFRLTLAPGHRMRDRKPYHDLIFWLRRLSRRLVLPTQTESDSESW
jgi:hypothetical protein